MSRHYYRGVFLILIAGMFPAASDARPRNSPIYDGTIDFGSQVIRLDDGCLAINGTVKSGTFFDDLKRTEIGNRSEFRKRGRVVTDYPESLTTSIRIDHLQCAATSTDPPPSALLGELNSFKFQVEWKTGMKLRPAVLSPIVAHCMGASQDFATPLITCEITVGSGGVPLADHLIVSVFAPDGKRLARLSAGP